MGKLRQAFVDPFWAYKIPFQARIPGGLATPLSVRKAVLRQQAALANMPADFTALFLATAMIETTSLLPADRDPKKDGTDSENRSIWNLSTDMLRVMGCGAPAAGAARWAFWDTDAQMAPLIAIMKRFIDAEGSQKFLFFVRAGRDGYDKLKGTIYEWKVYMAAVGTALEAIENDPSLLSDNRRVEMIVPYVDGKNPQGVGQVPPPSPI